MVENSLCSIFSKISNWNHILETIKGHNNLLSCIGYFLSFAWTKYYGIHINWPRLPCNELHCLSPFSLFPSSCLWTSSFRELEESALSSVKSVRVFFVEPFGRPRFLFTGLSVSRHNSRRNKKTTPGYLSMNWFHERIAETTRHYCTCI